MPYSWSPQFFCLLQEKTNQESGFLDWAQQTSYSHAWNALKISLRSVEHTSLPACPGTCGENYRHNGQSTFPPMNYTSSDCLLSEIARSSWSFVADPPPECWSYPPRFYPLCFTTPQRRNNFSVWPSFTQNDLPCLENPHELGFISTFPWTTSQRKKMLWNRHHTSYDLSVHTFPWTIKPFRRKNYNLLIGAWNEEDKGRRRGISKW